MSNRTLARWRPVTAFLVALTALALPAAAQQPSPARLAEAKQAFYKQLGLTPAQITKIEAIEKKYGTKVQTKLAEMKKKYGENPPADKQTQIRTEMMQFFKPIQEASNKELNAVLTPAQQKKVKEIQARQASGGMGARP